MRTFNCIVSLAMNTGGVNPHHEVPKYGISKAEVIILRAIHGKDAVAVTQAVGDMDMPDMAIYQQLAETYPPKMIEKLFGIQLTDLGGSDLDDFESDLGDERLTALPKAPQPEIHEEIEPKPVNASRMRPVGELS